MALHLMAVLCHNIRKDESTAHVLKKFCHCFHLFSLSIYYKNFKQLKEKNMTGSLMSILRTDTDRKFLMDSSYYIFNLTAAFYGNIIRDESVESSWQRYQVKECGNGVHFFCLVSFRGADVQVANFCAAMDTLIDQDGISVIEEEWLILFQAFSNINRLHLPIQ